jgi:uncharacterized protein
MDARLTNVRLAVEDVDRSCRFYEALGWKRASVSIATIAVFQLGPMAFSVWRKDIIENELGLDEPLEGGSGRIILDQHVENQAKVSKVLDEVKSHGGTIICDGEDGPLGANHYGCFADPDGHIWRIVFSRILKLNDDGSVTVPDGDGTE